MAERQVRLHPGRERDGGVCHAERRPHAGALEILVRLPRRERERVYQQSDAEVRVLELRPRIARELIARENSYICCAS